MTHSIQPYSSQVSFFTPPSFFVHLQDKVEEVFSNIKEALIPKASGDLANNQVINLRALQDSPGDVVEGTIWGGFLALSAYFAVDSCYELCQVFTVEHAADQKFEKIGFAVKAAFVDLLSFGSSSVYLARWADSVDVISLGQYLPVVNNLCFGLSLVINGVEAAAEVYNIWNEKEAVLKETAPDKIEIHKKWLCHSLMKLIGNVSMVAWAALGIGALAGLAVSPILLSLLVGVGCVLGMASFFYKNHIIKLSKIGATSIAVSG